MKETIQTIYRCEYCNKLYQRKHACELHEKHCHHNPDNDRACFDCVHLTKKDYPVYYDHYDGSETERYVNALYCPIFEKFVHPPKVEAKGNAFDFGDILNDPMPRECDEQNWLNGKP